MENISIFVGFVILGAVIYLMIKPKKQIKDDVRPAGGGVTPTPTSSISTLPNKKEFK